jgi:hypothetical protein
MLCVMAQHAEPGSKSKINYWIFKSADCQVRRFSSTPCDHIHSRWKFLLRLTTVEHHYHYHSKLFAAVL